MKKLSAGLLGCFYFFSVYSSIGQTTAYKSGDCGNLANDQKIHIAVSQFEMPDDISAAEISKLLPGKIAESLTKTNCFMGSYLPSSQNAFTGEVLILGNITDYFSPAESAGKARIAFGIRIVNAINEQVIASTDITVKGKMFLGIGADKSTSDAIDKAVAEAVNFILMNRDKFPSPEVQTTRTLKPSTGKSILQQQEDYAEKMRQRDKQWANELLSKNYNLDYSNPPNYNTVAPQNKGEWYAEYTINGKKVTLYEGSEKLFSRSGGRKLNEVSCRLMVPKPFRQFIMKFTDPANFPEIRKFEFGKPEVHSKKIMAHMTNPVVIQDTAVNFHVFLTITDPLNGEDYNLIGTTGTKDKYDNIISGYFEILYFDSKNNGILEANFALTVKGVKGSWSHKPKDISITGGKIRIRLDDRK